MTYEDRQQQGPIEQVHELIAQYINIKLQCLMDLVRQSLQLKTLKNVVYKLMAWRSIFICVSYQEENKNKITAE